MAPPMVSASLATVASSGASEITTASRAEAGGRLAAEDPLRAVGQRARNRHARALPAAQLAGTLPALLPQPDVAQRLLQPHAPLGARQALAGEEVLDVLVRAQDRKQVEGLEDEAEAEAPDAVFLALAERGDVAPVRTHMRVLRQVPDARDGYVALARSAGQELGTAAPSCLACALDQPETKVVALVLEAMREPGKLREALDLAARRDVPVVLLTAGNSAGGRAMVAAHSGGTLPASKPRALRTRIAFHRRGLRLRVRLRQFVRDRRPGGT